MPSQRYIDLREDNLPDLHNNVLLKACQEDPDLLSELLYENKEFLFSIIAHYKGSIESLKNKFNVDEEELLQHAYIAVITAIRDFDFNKGIKFTTYIYRPIIWEINQLLYNDSRLVRLSRSAVDLLKQMEKVENELGYFPKAEELAILLDVTVERIENVLRFASELTSLNSLESFEPEDYSIGYESKVMDKIYVENLLKNSDLSEFETQVINLIMDGNNNSQIAKKLNVYPMTVNRALNRIKNKLDNNFESKRLSKYESEIGLIAEEMIELNCIMNIEQLKDLLDVCGYNISKYSSRVLYYIRQQAISRLDQNLSECNDFSQ
ncbi:sigma-70 family RNA polymerase sigma factor [Bacillus cereus]